MDLLELNEGDLLNAALAYAERGWPVLPLLPREKKPHGRLVPPPQEGQPGPGGGLKQATLDQTQILAWWLDTPNANIGLLTGVEHDVLDVDGPDGIASMAELAPGYKHPGPVASTGKGFHLLFEITGARNAAKKLPGLDFRGTNGYIVAPPSVHPNGHKYLWRRDGPLPEPTPWLYQLVTAPRAERTSDPIDPSSMDSIVYAFLNSVGDLRQLRAVGGRFLTNCIFPDHRDSDPSFWLYPENNSFYCFGCGEWGDTLDLTRSFMAGLTPPSSWREGAA